MELVIVILTIVAGLVPFLLDKTASIERAKQRRIEEANDTIQGTTLDLNTALQRLYDKANQQRHYPRQSPPEGGDSMQDSGQK